MQDAYETPFDRYDSPVDVDEAAQRVEARLARLEAHLDQLERAVDRLGAKLRQNSRDVYSWLSRPYAEARTFCHAPDIGPAGAIAVMPSLG